MISNDARLHKKKRKKTATKTITTTITKTQTIWQLTETNHLNALLNRVCKLACNVMTVFFFYKKIWCAPLENSQNNELNCQRLK